MRRRRDAKARCYSIIQRVYVIDTPDHVSTLHACGHLRYCVVHVFWWREIRARSDRIADFHCQTFVFHSRLIILAGEQSSTQCLMKLSRVYDCMNSTCCRSSLRSTGHETSRHLLIMIWIWLAAVCVTIRLRLDQAIS
jgi:hypothetical protein